MRAEAWKTFDQIVRAIGERLRPLGFSRRGTVLRLVAQDNCGIIEFQRSVKSSSDNILFTVNVGVVCGDIMDSEGPLQDLHKARVAYAHIRWRIGAFLPGRPDRWWEIGTAATPEVLAREISDLILQGAVPAIQRYMSADAVIGLWESGESPGITDGHRVDLLAAIKAKRKGRTA